MPERHCREALKTFKPYMPAQEDGFIRLNANENPFSLPEAVKKEIAQAIMQCDVARYSDSNATMLRQEIAAYVNYPSEAIVAGNGSSELIQLLMHAFLGSGERIVGGDPTFTMYMVIARVAGVQSVEVPLREDFSVDVEAMIATARREEARMIFLCTPNNPTGNPMPRSDIQQIIDETDCLVVVDEAYGEFASDSFLPLVEQHPRVVVLRTLSKAFGLAGIRVGYAVAGEVVARELNKVRLPYNLNSLSQLAATIVMQNPEAIWERVAMIKRERLRLEKALFACQGVTPFPSEANFILFRTARSAQEVDAVLKSDKILVRDFSGHPLLPDCLRVTVGKPEENDAFIASLQKAMR